MFGDILSGAAAIQNSWVNVWNAYQEKKQFDYAKELQNTIFNREDNAVQRRVNDLKAAGLSPVLAAGSGANSGPVVSTKAPHMEQIDPLQFMNMIKMKEDISLTKTQQDLVKSQIKNTDASTKNTDASTTGKYYDNKIKKIDSQNSDDSGIGNAGTDFGRFIKDFTGLGNKYNNYNQSQKEIDNKKNQIKEESNSGSNFWEFNIR